LLYLFVLNFVSFAPLWLNPILSVTLKPMSPLTLSFLVSCTACALLLPPGLWLAWRIGAGRAFWGRGLLEAFLSLPLVLPPTVVGYGLLLLLGRGTTWGRWLQDAAHIRLLFTWQGAALAAAIMALPLFVRAAAVGFASVDPELLEAGRTLGASEWRLAVSVLAPLAYRGVLAGAALAFARALGEFGATLMVSGAIPGRTETLPLALFAATQNGDDAAALRYALTLTAIAWGAVGLAGAWGGRIARVRGNL